MVDVWTGIVRLHNNFLQVIMNSCTLRFIILYSNTLYKMENESQNEDYSQDEGFDHIVPSNINITAAVDQYRAVDNIIIFG